MRMIQYCTRTIILSAAILLGIAINLSQANAASLKIAYVAGGCFWCVESDFESVTGVIEVVSGYTGGHTANPTYKRISKGGTGHFEAVEITYDPDKISYETLMHLFFRSIDPTDAGGQFCDRGDSYRTAVFVSNTGEKSIAQAAKAEAQKALGQKIVTPPPPPSCQPVGFIWPKPFIKIITKVKSAF